MKKNNAQAWHSVSAQGRIAERPVRTDQFQGQRAGSGREWNGQAALQQSVLLAH